MTPRPDPELAGDVDQITDAGAHPAAVFRKGPEIGVVGGKHGHARSISAASIAARGTSRHPRLGARWTKPSDRRVMPTTETRDPGQGVLRRE